MVPVRKCFNFVMKLLVFFLGKTTVTRKLILQLNGVKWCTPPNDIRHIRDYFDDHPNLRTAYYALGNYIAALQISTLLKRKLVVMDR